MDEQQTNQRKQASSFLVDSSPRIDTVVIFLPDVWRVVPSKLEFENLQSSLKKQLENKVAALYEPLPLTPVPNQQIIKTTTTESTPNVEPIVKIDTETTIGQDDSIGITSGVETEKTPNKAEVADEEEKTSEKEPTHWSLLDIKSMKVNELRVELSARGIDSKGIKSQLVAKLMKAVKSEQETEEQAKAAAETSASEEKAKSESMDEGGGDPKQEPAPEQVPQDAEMTVIDQTEPQNESDAPSAGQGNAEVKEEPKPKMRDEKEIKEMKTKLERAYDFRPTQSGILVHPNRTAKGGKFDCRTMSLTSLLDYRPEDNKEHSFEVSLFAEAFSQMLMRDNAFKIFKGLVASAEAEDEKEKKANEKKEDATVKTQEEKEKEGNAEGTEKEETKDVNGAAKEASKDVDKKDSSKASVSSKKDGKSKDDKKKRSPSPSALRDDKKLVKPIDPALLQAFLYFDHGYCGYIVNKDLEDIMLSLGLRLTRSQMQKVTKKLVHRDVLHYRKLTDIVFVKETKEKKFEPLFAQLPPDEELAIGNSTLLQRKEPEVVPKPTSSPRGSRRSAAVKNELVDVSTTGTVMFKGVIVDVGQMLNQIEKLEQEKRTIEQRLCVVEKDLGNYKDQKHSLERRKRRLEDDLKDVKKRLHDAEKCLKNSQDDTVQLKTALHRCKEYSESIARLVDKTLPSKREKDETSSERSEKSGRKSEKAEKTEMKDASSASLSAETGANSAPDNANTNSQNSEDVKAEIGGMVVEEHSPAPDEELAVRDEITESDRTEADLNMLNALGEDNMQA